MLSSHLFIVVRKGRAGRELACSQSSFHGQVCWVTGVDAVLIPQDDFVDLKKPRPVDQS